MIGFNQEQELIWAYYSAWLNEWKNSKVFRRFVYYVLLHRSLFISPSTQKYLYFGGQQFAANGNDLLFGYFETHGVNLNVYKVIGLQMSCTNCMSHSVNMVYGYHGNGQKELYGCISNEHHVGTDLHAWGFVAINFDDITQQNAFVSYATTTNVRFYCSGIHVRQAGNLEVYITRVDTLSQARGFFYLNSDYADIYSANIPKSFPVKYFEFKNPDFTDNYIEINQVTYFYNSIERIYLSGSYKNQLQTYNKAFMHQIGDDTQNADKIQLIGTFIQSYAQLQSIVSNFYPLTLILLQSTNRIGNIPNYTIDYEIINSSLDGRKSSITLPGFIPILAYTEETPLFNYTHSNQTYECLIDNECFVNVGILTLNNCVEGIESLITLNISGLTTDMSQSDIVHYSVDEVYQLPFILSFTYTPTGDSFKGLDYTDYLLTMHTYFDYPNDPNGPGVYKDFQFYQRIWDQCTYHRKEIYSDPVLDQVYFVLGQSMSYYLLPKLGTAISGCEIVSSISVSYENQSSNPGLINTYVELITNQQYLLIYTNQESYLGTYNITILTYFSKPYGVVANFTYSFELVVIPSSAQRVNIAPYFETSLKNQTINVGASMFYTLPRTFDQNGNSIIIDYHLGVAQLFTDIIDNQGNGILIFNPKKEHIGDYAVEIWLKDDHPTQPLTTKYKFGIIVVGGNGSFSYENITDEERFASQTQFIGTIRAKIKRIDYKGVMLILFDTNIKIPPNYVVRLNESLEINLQQNGNKKLKTNYSIENMKGNKMTVQLYFESPANISNNYVSLMSPQFIIGMGLSNCQILVELLLRGNKQQSYNQKRLSYLKNSASLAI
eukprot:403374290